MGVGPGARERLVKGHKPSVIRRIRPKNLTYNAVTILGNTVYLKFAKNLNILIKK